MLKVVLFIFLCVAVCESLQTKNVCPKIVDYLITPLSSRCWYNPDVGSSPMDVVTRHGYKFEAYSVYTEDDYKLRIFRIPSKNPQNATGIVFLQHGITYTAMTWLSLGNQSLAFKLFDMGYDVWLGNSRGTLYSNEHKFSNISQRQYWDFSFFEMGYYDIPAVLEFIRKETKTKKKIIYIGHSMGGTISAVYATTRKKEANERLAAIISVAPVVYMKHSFNYIYLLAPIIAPLFKLLNTFNIYSFGMINTNIQTLFYRICLYGFFSRLCKVLSPLILAVTFQTIPPEMIPMQWTQSPTGISLKTVNHYTQQILNGGRFQCYDLGPKNQVVYQKNQPPAFNVSEIQVPYYLLYGKQDVLADEKDVQKLYSDLKTSKYILAVGNKSGVEFKHLDFVLNKQKVAYFYEPLFNILRDMNKPNMQ